MLEKSHTYALYIIIFAYRHFHKFGLGQQFLGWLNLRLVNSGICAEDRMTYKLKYCMEGYTLC